MFVSLCVIIVRIMAKLCTGFSRNTCVLLPGVVWEICGRVTCSFDAHESLWGAVTNAAAAAAFSRHWCYQTA
jgi:hypothetical protein